MKFRMLAEPGRDSFSDLVRWLIAMEPDEQPARLPCTVGNGNDHLDIPAIASRRRRRYDLSGDLLLLRGFRDQRHHVIE